MHEDFKRFQGNILHDLNLKKLKRYSGYLPIEGTESWLNFQTFTLVQET